MRNKYDFENLVYEKAGVLAAKERKYAGYRKAAVSTAAVFTVLVFAVKGLSNLSVHDMSAGTAAADNGTKAEDYANDNAGAAAVNDYFYAADVYGEDNYTNAMTEEQDGATEKSAEIQENGDGLYEEKPTESDEEIRLNGEDFKGEFNNRIEYFKGEEYKTISDENAWSEFSRAFYNLRSTTEYIEAENYICTVELVNADDENGTEYITRLRIYENCINIDYSEYRFDSDFDYTLNESGEKRDFCENDEVVQCEASEELSELIEKFF